MDPTFSSGQWVIMIRTTKSEELLSLQVLHHEYKWSEVHLVLVHDIFSITARKTGKPTRQFLSELWVKWLAKFCFFNSSNRLDTKHRLQRCNKNVYHYQNMLLQAVQSTPYTINNDWMNAIYSYTIYMEWMNAMIAIYCDWKERIISSFICNEY